jgi:hypothetical protein
MPNFRFVVIATGDRNFVVSPEQHTSSAHTSWHPGSDVLESWNAFLHSIGAGLDFELDGPTFAKFIRHSDGTAGWVLRTLDFGTAGYDPVAFAEWQCSSRIYNLDSQRASDHKPVEIKLRRRTRPKRRAKNARDAPIPAWLFQDSLFVNEWSDAVRSWGHTRAQGFSALGEFVDITRAHAKDWLEERCVEAQSPQHKFELAMAMHLSSRLRTPEPMSRISRRLAAYPRLRSLREFEIDLSCSSVYVRSTNDLVDHIHTLANETIADREREADQVHDGVCRVRCCTPLLQPT